MDESFDIQCSPATTEGSCNTIESGSVNYTSDAVESEPNYFVEN